MKKFIYLIVLALILGLALTGCLLSNVGQVPTTEQSGITYLTKNGPSPVLVARWKFDEESGVTTVADNSGNNNTGDIYGATPGEVGNFGNALSFDGADDYVDCGAEVDDSINTGITLEAWIMPAFQQNGGIISNDITNSSKKGYDFFLWYGNAVYGRLYIDFCLGRASWAIPSLDWYNQWHHVAATWNGSKIMLYVDESMVAEVEYSGTYYDPGKDTFIGAINYLTPAYFYFNRLIDEVRIWGSVLDASQLDDMLPPVVSSPNDDVTYLLNQAVSADWSAVDGTGSGPGSGVTGVASVVGSIIKGSALDTSTAGSHSFTVTATDYAKNEVTTTVTYNVNYVFNDFLPPVSLGKPFKLGRTIPVKFQLWDDQGNFVTDAVANIFVKKISNDGTSGEIVAVSTAAATNGNLFRYDFDSEQYIFNLSTKLPLNNGVSWSAGTWEIRIELDDGMSYYENIVLRP